MKNSKKTALVAVVISIFPVATYSQMQSRPLIVTDLNGIDSNGQTLGEFNNVLVDFMKIKKIMDSYKVEKSSLPDSVLDLYFFAQDKEKEKDLWPDFVNPDSMYSDRPQFRKSPKEITPYVKAKPKNQSESSKRNPVFIFTDLHFHRNSYVNDEGVSFSNPSGYFFTLRENGLIGKIPYDVVDFTYDTREKSLSPYFSDEGDMAINVVNYDERSAFLPKSSKLGIGKPTRLKNGQVILDNGGPESLIQLSRRLSYPTRYGIEREKLWQTFDPAQPEFTLEQIQVGAQKLGLIARVEKVTLAQLQAAQTPALLFLQDDGRIVTLLSLDDDRAVVVDRGVTRNVPREVLQNRYSGEALLPAQTPVLQAEDGVREVKLPSYTAEVEQKVVLRNTGDKTLPLQLDYPLLGVTEAKLSKESLAPGESATLDLKMKWRSVLKAPTQNVLVSLSTGEGQPRTQLAFLLVPPAGEKAPEPQIEKPGTAEAAGLPRAEDDPTVQIGQARPTVKVGNAAPDFTTVDMNGKSWKLSELKNQKSVLLTFFPKCFTGGCANHLSSLRDKQREFDALGVQILAVSVDAAEGEKGQKAFAKQWQLGFPLVPDTSRSLSKLFGAVQSDKQLSARMSLFIDKTGLVRIVETDVPVATHGQEMLEQIKALP